MEARQCLHAVCECGFEGQMHTNSEFVSMGWHDISCVVNLAHVYFISKREYVCTLCTNVFIEFCI